jgi:hypothetical protein
MLRRFLLGILVVSLASMAWAGVPDLNNSTVTTAAASGASVFALPNGAGTAFTEAFGAGGATTDATITLTLIDTNGDPIYLYPFSDLWLETSGGGLAYCSGGTTADASTDENGQAFWANAIAGGGYSAGENAVVMVAGSPVSGGGVNVTFNSADISGDLIVNLTDISNFTVLLGGDFTSHPQYAGDFNNDGQINLSDIARFTPGIGTACN